MHQPPHSQSPADTFAAVAAAARTNKINAADNEIHFKYKNLIVSADLAKQKVLHSGAAATATTTRWLPGAHRPLATLPRVTER